MAGKGDIKAGGAYVELFVKATKLEQGLKSIGQKLGHMGRTLADFGTKIAAAGAAATTAFGAAAMKFAESGDALNKMAQRTGISVEALSGLGYAARQSGSSLEDIEKASKKMASVLHDAAGGSAAAEKTLSDLGLPLEELQGLSPDQQFMKLAMALTNVKDASTRSALAQEVFGKSGTQLLPLFAEGEKGISALISKFTEMGGVMTKEAAESATRMGDAIDDVKESFHAATNAIGAALAPAITSLAEKMTAAIGPITQWIKTHQELIVTLAKVSAGVTTGGIALIGFGKLMTVTGALASKLAFAVGGVSQAILFLGTPVGAVAFAVCGLGIAIGGLAAWMVKASGIVPQLVDALKPLGDAVEAIASSLLSGNFKRAWEVASTSIQLVGSLGVDVFKQLPEFASYAAGRIARGLVDAFAESFKWALNASQEFFMGILNAAKDFSPKLLKAMLTGDISGAMEEFQKALLPVAKRIASSAKTFGRGVKGGEAPTLNISERTQGLIDLLAGLTKPEGGGLSPATENLQASVRNALAGLGSSSGANGGIKLPFAIPSNEDILKKISDLTNKAISGGASALDWLDGKTSGSTSMAMPRGGDVSVSFSAAGLMAQGMGGGKTGIESTMKDQLRVENKQADELKAIRQLLERGKGLVFG